METLTDLRVDEPMTETLAALRSPVLVLALLACGLQAGTYYTWASGVMPGLGRVDDRTFVHAMQQINLAIVNPVFMLTFLGAPLLALVGIAATSGDVRRWTIAAAVLAVATLLVTIAGNVPLNDALDAAGRGLDGQQATAAREAFESGWVRLNIARTVTSAGSLGCLGMALLRA